MQNELLGIPDLDVYIVMGILIFFGLLEVISGYLERSKRKSSDWIQEFGGFVVLSLGIKPLIVGSAYFLGIQFFSETQGLLSTKSLWLTLPVYLLADDILQYWYHRSAHEYPFLWKLHRAHHQAEEMGFFVSYRNAGLYYILMPNIWWTGIFTFLGGGIAVAVGLILKQLVIIGSHSTVTWDSFFYKNKLLHPLMTVLERVIITPAFHHSHHGRSKLDGISDPNGNYGNMFSIWDQLFDTALFTRRFPSDYGLMNDPKEHWTTSYFYPFVKAKDPQNEMSGGHKKTKTAHPKPKMIELEKGKKYLYCQCGKSGNQPFCDGSHQGTKFTPLLFEAKRTGKAKLCTCKLTEGPPFCDGSHKNF